MMGGWTADCSSAKQSAPTPIVVGGAGVLAVHWRGKHNTCMTSITIRDVPDHVRDELAARARQSGRSLQEYLRSELTQLASRPDPGALMAQVRERTRRTGSRLSASQILTHRDHDRR